MKTIKNKNINDVVDSKSLNKEIDSQESEINDKETGISADFLENNFNLNGLKEGIIAYGTTLRYGHPEKFQEYLDKANKMLSEINDVWRPVNSSNWQREMSEI